MTTGRINQVTTLGRNIQRLSYGLLVFLFGFLLFEWITLRPPLAPAKRCSESRVQAESRLANWECSRTRSFLPSLPKKKKKKKESDSRPGFAHCHKHTIAPRVIAQTFRPLPPLSRRLSVCFRLNTVGRQLNLGRPDPLQSNTSSALVIFFLLQIGRAHV